MVEVLRLSTLRRLQENCSVAQCHTGRVLASVVYCERHHVVVMFCWCSYGCHDCVADKVRKRCMCVILHVVLHQDETECGCRGSH